MMPSHPFQPATFPRSMYFLAEPPFLLRPQLLTRIEPFSRAGLPRRLPAPIDPACSGLEDVWLSAGSLVSQLFAEGLTAMIDGAAFLP